MKAVSAAVLVVVCAVAAAGPTPGECFPRSLRCGHLPLPPLAAEHPESVAEHMVGVHSPDFDHEAFLGRAEAERFDQLPPEEAKRRLG